jgi:hypothetical protein
VRDHIENTVLLLLRCCPLRRSLFTEQLPSDSPGIVDVFTGRYLETGAFLCAYCIATAVLVRFVTSAQQRIYTTLYIYIHEYHLMVF